MHSSQTPSPPSGSAAAPPQREQQQQEQAGTVPFIPKTTFIERLTDVPVSTAFILLVCFVSFLFGALGPHDRGLMKAAGTSSPVRISLYSAFASSTAADKTSVKETATTVTGINEQAASAPGDVTGELSRQHAGADRKDGALNENKSVSASTAGSVASCFGFIHRYTMATLLVASSGELTFIVAAFYGFAFDLEKRLLGSRRFVTLLVGAFVVRMLWLALANASLVSRWLAMVSFGGDEDGHANGIYPERHVGLRPGPAWLCLMLLIVYEKRIRSCSATHSAYQPLPAVRTTEGTPAAAASASSASEGGEMGAFTEALPPTAQLPAMSTAGRGEREEQEDVRELLSFASFPFGSSSAVPHAAKLRLFGRIPICAGTFRTVIAVHLLLIMGFFEETVPAIVLGIIL